MAKKKVKVKKKAKKITAINKIKSNPIKRRTTKFTNKIKQTLGIKKKAR